jgi:hypothetical protein
MSCQLPAAQEPEGCIIPLCIGTWVLFEQWLSYYEACALLVARYDSSGNRGSKVVVASIICFGLKKPVGSGNDYASFDSPRRKSKDNTAILPGIRDRCWLLCIIRRGNEIAFLNARLNVLGIVGGGPS